jgi:hypothetical protein
LRWISQGCATLALGYSRFAPPGRSGCGLRALDEALRQFQLGTQVVLAVRHLAVVDFMIVAGKMKQAVEHKHLDLSGKRVALPGCLRQCGGDADGEVAGDSLRAEALCRKGKHICGLVFAAKLAIELANGGVGGEQHRHLALEPD